MTRKIQSKAQLASVPALQHETLYIGVDIGKFQHAAGFLSTTLLARHERFEGCPTLTFEQSRAGFRAFAERIRELVHLGISLSTITVEACGVGQRLLQRSAGVASATDPCP